MYKINVYMVNSIIDCTMKYFIFIYSLEAASDQCHDSEVLQTPNILSYSCITDTCRLTSVCVCVCVCVREEVEGTAPAIIEHLPQPPPPPTTYM